MQTNSETVSQFMSMPAFTIGADQPLSAAEARMREHKVRHLPVLQGGRIRGILSDRDIDLVSGLPGVDTAEVTVQEAMSADPYTVAPSTPLTEVLSVMAEHKYGTAVVAEGAQVVGIFTTIDAMSAFSSFLAKRGGAE